MNNKNLKEDGDFYFGHIIRVGDGSYEMAVYYMYAGEIHTYIAVGEDNIDLKRDWAYEWLDIFGEEEEEHGDTDKPDSTD